LPSRTAILAVAGSGKSTEVVNRALACTEGRVLIITFTVENQRRLESALREKTGLIPSRVSVSGWYAFLINQCIKPYQLPITKTPFLLGELNFVAPAPRFEKKDSLRFFADSSSRLYKDRLSHLAVHLNELTKGAVVERIADVYRHIFIDEVQDCGGYDLDLFDLLLAVDVNTCMVGDPRQSILSTNHGTRHKKYRREGLWTWFKERSNLVSIEERADNYRCHPLVCAFADRIYPTLPPSRSQVSLSTGHDGVFIVSEDDVDWYLRTFRPDAVLRDSVRTVTGGREAINIGHAKGATFERVLLFPTKSMVSFLVSGNASDLGDPARFYVAVTRARFSVAVVVPMKSLPKVLAHPDCIRSSPPQPV
jgi:hypothetical protein